MTEYETRFLIQRSLQPQELIEVLSSFGMKPKQLPTVDIVDRYFDTPSWKLYHGGWTYRWRAVEGNRKIGLNSVCSANGIGCQQKEVTQEVARFPAKGARVPAGPVQKCLAKIQQDKLRELFQVKNHRQRFQLRTIEGALINMTLNQATVRPAEPDGKSVKDNLQYTELTLERIEGPQDALRGLATMLQHRFSLLPARLSQFERCLRPFGLHPPGPPKGDVGQSVASPFLRKLRDRHLKPRDLSNRLVYRCLLEQFEIMLDEEPIAWEGLETEGVHQMRVATRRIRAALLAYKSVFETAERKKLNREFKWLAKVLGRVRDLNVLQHNLNGYVDEFPADGVLFLDGYQRYLEEQMKVARKQLIDCLSGNRYRELKSNFSKMLRRGPSSGMVISGGEELICDAARRLLGKQYRRVLLDGRAIMPTSPDVELHALRIDCKHLRYLFEFFRTVYGKSLDPFLKPLKTLQNVLGEFQDAHIATQQLFQYARRGPIQAVNRDELLALGQLIAIQRRQASFQRAKFCKAWSRFDRRRARKRMLEVLS